MRAKTNLMIAIEKAVVKSRDEEILRLSWQEEAVTRRIIRLTRLIVRKSPVITVTTALCTRASYLPKVAQSRRDLRRVEGRFSGADLACMLGLSFSRSPSSASPARATVFSSCCRTPDFPQKCSRQQCPRQSDELSRGWRWTGAPGFRSKASIYS